MDFKGTPFALCLACCMVGGAVCARTSRSGPKSHRRPVLVVGWHDEMNGVRDWRPLSGPNEPDVFAARPGAMTLRMPHVPDGFPYTYQWGGVTRLIVGGALSGASCEYAWVRFVRREDVPALRAHGNEQAIRLEPGG